jgi:hypothetical protein
MEIALSVKQIDGGTMPVDGNDLKCGSGKEYHLYQCATTQYRRISRLLAHRGLHELTLKALQG